MENDEITMFTFDLPMYMHPPEISGIRTGYYTLNSPLSEWQNHEYVIVGYTNPEDAREFIDNNASAANRFNHKIAVFAPNKEVTYSILVPERTNVPHVCESIFELKKRVRYLLREEDVKAVFIDDLTMLNCEELKLPPSINASELISRSLCQLVRKIDISIILLVSITSENDTPRISDLNKNGNNEEYADVIIFLTRDRNDKSDPLVAKNRWGEISDGS